MLSQARHREVQEFLHILERRLEPESPLRGIPCLECPWSGVCADRDLACAAFRSYVAGNVDNVPKMPREPSRDVFKLVMTEKF